MNKLLFEEYKDLSQYELNAHLFVACQEGSLEKVKYLLTSLDLKLHADINSHAGTPNYILTFACYYGNLDIIEYLLLSPDLKERANIHDNLDNPLKMAGRERQLEVVKYLLTSPKLKDHADVYADDGHIFNSLCLGEKTNIVEYLIFDYKIKKIDTITAFLEHKLPFMDKVKKMFEQRELHDELKQELILNETNNKNKLKI